MKKGSVRCSATTRSGRACRAWAVRGTDPPLCSTHAGRTVGRGGQPGNANARRHGFYSRYFTVQELADLVALEENVSALEPEIAAARVSLGRVLAFLERERGRLSAADFAKLTRLVFRGARTVALLLRDRRALSGDAADGLMGAIGQALDELSAEWGVDL